MNIARKINTAALSAYQMIFWNIVGFALHLFTDIPYFVAEKKKKVV